MLKYWRCGPLTTEIKFHPNLSMNMGGRVVFHLCFYMKYYNHQATFRKTHALYVT